LPHRIKTETRLAGVVTSCTYLGDKCEYVVDLGATPLHVAKGNPQLGDRLAPGTPVSVALPPAGVQLLPGHAS
jgi:TOBE domain